MGRIKVCFIQTSLYPFFNENCGVTHGGSELQLYLLSRELSNNTNFEIAIITGDFGQKNIEEYGNIKVFKSFNPKSTDSLLEKVIQATKYYRMFKRINADVYFTSAPNSTVGLVSLFCKLNNKKHIHRTAHENEVNLSYSKKGIVGKIFIAGLEHSDVVLTQNKTHKRLLKQNHDVDAEVLKNSFIIKENDARKKGSILWVARCDYWKQPELFTRLAKNLPDERFIMIAPPVYGKEPYQKEIKEIAATIENLRFIDRVPFNKIQRYFDEAQIFINTSEHEGFPNTFLQAGIGKTPIMSLNVNPDDFISKYNCGFFCENDFDTLLENTGTLMSNKETWKEMSENVFNYVKENHDIHKNVEQLTNWICEVVGVRS